VTRVEALRIAWDLCIAGAMMVAAVAAVAAIAWWMEHRWR